MADPFPPDRGLQLRMVVALLTAAALAVAALAVVVWLAVAVEWWLALVVVGFAAGGLVAGPAGHRASARGGRSRAEPGAERRAGELVERLAAVGDVRVPAVVLDADDAPLAWTTALPWRRPTIHLTSGLAERCTTRELEVVLAHELTHIANHDAWVMTVVGGPPSWILDGIRDYWAERGDLRFGTVRYGLGVLLLGSWSAALALPGAVAARLVSRHRELAADRGAATLTGSPAAVAATLRSLTDQLDSTRRLDLRLAADLEMLNFLPAASGRAEGIWATHPPLARRLAQLDRMERELQADR